MNRNECIILFFAVFCVRAGNANPECESWEKIKRSIKDKFSISCTVVDDCIGLFCSGKYEGYDINVKTEVNPCEEPVSIDLILDIPNSNVRNVSHSFRDGTSYDVPDIAGHPVRLFVAVSLTEEEGRNLNVGVTVRSREISLLDFPIVSNGTIVRAKCKSATQRAIAISANPVDSVKPTAKSRPVSAPQVISTKTCKDCKENETCVNVFGDVAKCECKAGFKRNEVNECLSGTVHEGNWCNVTLLEQCAEHEICVQTEPNTDNGTCECADHYHVNTSHHCVPDKQPTENVALILSIVLPICFLLVCSACVFVIVRQRIVQRIRERYRHVRTYEVVSIGNDDDDEPLVA